jgi:hypothetical protein
MAKPVDNSSGYGLSKSRKACVCLPCPADAVNFRLRQINAVLSFFARKKPFLPGGYQPTQDLLPNAIDFSIGYVGAAFQPRS